ncbi:hypothetical protein GINT2_000011 [Glugoides intestinalis]
MAINYQNILSTMKRIFNEKSVTAGLILGECLASTLAICILIKGGLKFRTAIAGVIGISLQAGAIVGACVDPTFKGIMLCMISTCLTSVAMIIYFTIIIIPLIDKLSYTSSPTSGKKTKIE